jgi:hypothetical protein
MKSNQNFTETNSCEWILKETYASVYPSKQHESRPGRSHICCVNLMTSSVGSVITTMILKEIDIDMRNKIVKIKRILEKPEHHYKLWGHLLD